MELVSAILIVLAVGMLVALFVSRPFLQGKNQLGAELAGEAQKQEHLRSSLLAERDRVLTALQELDFDFALGKVPEEEYPAMRASLLQTGANVLRQLDSIGAEAGSVTAVEDRIEAAVAAHRADARRTEASRSDARREPVGEAAVASTNGGSKANGHKDDSLEDLIAARKRMRSEAAAGFCPKCGKPAQKSDKFCSKCGTTL